MWKLAVSQLRAHPRRYVAVLLAITLGTMFLAGSLLVTSSAKETTKHMLGATYANADLLITAKHDAAFDSGGIFYEQLGDLESPGDLEAIPAVQEVYPVIQVATGLVLDDDSPHRGSLDSDSDFLLATNMPDDASLLATPVTAGALPTRDSDIAIDTGAAERHDLTVGDTVTLRGMSDDQETEFRVSGIMDTSSDQIGGSLDSDSDFLLATNMPDDASLLATPVTAGALPTRDSDIAIDTGAAERHDLTVGDTVTLRGMSDDQETEFRVSGIMDTSSD